MNKLTLTTLLLTSLAIGHLAASTVNVVYTGANGQKDSAGYLISPYSATLNGVSTTIYCDDFANTVTLNQAWTANLTSLSGSLSNTRYGGLSQSLSTSATTSAMYNGTQLYEMAAWLTTQFAASGKPGYSSNGDIQDTIWGLFNPNAGNLGVIPPTPSSKSWLYSAEQNYASVKTSNFQILTNTAPLTESGKGQVQEFIIASPEPSSILLLGFGLIAVSLGGRRAMRRNKATVTA